MSDQKQPQTGGTAQLFNVVFDICLLRRGPQHLPTSITLALTALLVYLASGILIETVGQSEQAVARPLVSTLISTLVVYMILRGYGLQERFVQTWTAFASAGALISLVFVPILWSLNQAAATDSPSSPITALGFIFLVVWSFVVDAHIFRNALSSSFTVGFFFATLAFAVVTLSRYLIFEGG
ncbi:MAG: hypothetical protein QNJ40_08430 [Xanthomonadales bacterium]|nr:hypothetical protein [Xanthomonadales bacterium]